MITNVHGVEIRHTTMPIFWNLAGTGDWEPFTFNCIKKYVKQGKAFLDIGSWNGVFSVFADKLGAITYAVEPDTVAYIDTQNLIVMNEAKTLLDTCAISNVVGEAMLNTNGGWGNSESSLIQRSDNKGEKLIFSVTLQTYIDRHGIDMNGAFIKMDIEGSEIGVLEQSRDLIEKYKPTMHISFHPSIHGDFKYKLDYLFNIYNVVSDNGTKVNIANFKACLDNHEHAFLFTTESIN